MQTVTKRQAIDALTYYGHVYLGTSGLPLEELIERIDRHAEQHAEQMAIFAPLRHATRSKGLRVWFPSLKEDSGADSSLDISGADTTVYVRGQYLIVYTFSPANARCSFDSRLAVLYFLPSMSEALTV